MGTASTLDRLSVLGIVLSAVALLGGAILKGSGIASLWSNAAFLVVIVGTMAAVLLQTPMPVFRHAFTIVRWVFRTPHADTSALVASINLWSQIARREGVLALESQIARQQDPFLAKGLQLLVDRADPDQIREQLETELETQEQFDISAARVFEAMGTYAPTLGIIGAVMGLMAVMKNLADPGKLGVGISTAFTATIYGIGMSNLILLPVANKLKSIIATRANQKDMVIAGLIAIALGENPRSIEAKLSAYIPQFPGSR